MQLSNVQKKGKTKVCIVLFWYGKVLHNWTTQMISENKSIYKYTKGYVQASNEQDCMKVYE